MRLSITLLTLLHGVLLFAQNADVKTGCAPLEVAFTPPPNVTTFFWTFKDGGVSNLSNPSNVFTTPGTYDVEFRTAPGGPVLGTVKITVYPKPEIGISADPQSGCVPLTVKFADTTKLAGDIKIQNWSWTFGDGFPGNGNAPNHTYTVVGGYDVSLSITTNYFSCNVTQVFQNFIQTGVMPLVSFTTTPSPPVACDPPLTVSFTNTTVGGSGALSYSWNFGNGNTSGQPNPPDQTYTQNGSYTVVLTATDAFGCSATVTRPVAIGKPVAAFTAPDTVCVDENFTITNNSAFGDYSWNFGPNAFPATSTAANPTVRFTAPGLQTVTLTVTTGNNCSSTATKQIYADRADATFTVSPQYSCSDPTVFTFNPTSTVATQWAWSFSDGSISNVENPTYTWTTPDTTGYTIHGLFLDTVYLQVTNPSGCKDVFLLVDSIWRPNAKFIPNVQDGCAPLTVTFADSSISNEQIVQWSWHFDDGSPAQVNSTNAPVTHTFNSPGEYEVELVIRNSAGCIDTSYIVVIEVGEPVPGDFAADKIEVCPGDTVRFSSLVNDPRIDAWHYSSESDRLWHCFQEDSTYWVFNSQTGPLDVSLTTEYNGCFTTVTKEELILAKGPIAQIHYKTTCDSTLKFDFTSQSHDATNLMWYLGDGDSTDLATFSHKYNTPGTYTVVLKAENPSSGCPISYDTATVYPTILKAEFDLDDTICGGVPDTLDGSLSLGVNATCYKGYTWYFSFQRPLRTDKAKTEFFFGPSGPQTVWLEVEDINGCKDTLQKDIVIFNRNPQISAVPQRICIPDTVQFTYLTQPNPPFDDDIVSWEWNFGDGTTSTGKNPPPHIYATPPQGGTTFTIELRVEDVAGCPGFASTVVEVYKPTSNITTFPDPAHICAGQTVAFAGQQFTGGVSGLDWHWDFGNGSTATGQAVQQTFADPKQYQVKMVFTESLSGCKDSLYTTVDVQGPPNPMFTTTPNADTFCYNQIISFKNTSTSPYPLGSTFWDLGNGLTTSVPMPSTTFEKGTYTVTMVTQTSYGCSATVSRTFTAVGPVGDFTADKTLICKGDSIKYTLTGLDDVSSWIWDFKDGNTQQGGNPVTHGYDANLPVNSLPVVLVLYGEGGACPVTIEKTINFSPVDANFQTQATLTCAGAPIQFVNTSTAADISNWFFGDGETTTGANPSHEFPAEGTYQVKLVVTDQPLGCMDSITLPVVITGIPNLDVFGATTVCPDSILTIGVITPPAGATYVWAPASLVLSANDTSTVQVTVEETTNFTVTVIDALGCTDIDSVLITVPEAFDGATDLDTIVVKGTEVTLPVIIDPQYDYTWTPAPGPSGNPPLVIAPDTSVVYTLVVQDKLQCTESEYKFNIRVVPEKVYYPNAFTPNSDEANDAFFLSAVGEEELVQVLSLKVFNRWGQLVFEGSGNLDAVAWDGKQDGKDAPMDIYAWVAELQFATGRKISLKGDVALLR